MKDELISWEIENKIQYLKINELKWKYKIKTESR